MAHLDLKLENIVINDDWSLVLIDFETMKPLDQPIRDAIGTPGYFSPEICHVYR